MAGPASLILLTQAIESPLSSDRGATLASYDFTGTNGAAPPAGIQTRTTGVYAIQNNRLRIESLTATTALAWIYENSMAARSTVDVTCTFVFDAVTESYVTLNVQSDTVENTAGGVFGTTGYSVLFQPNNSLITLYRTPANGTATVLVAATALGFTIAVGTPFKVRFRDQIDGAGNLRVRAWLASNAEPSAWLMDYTDPTPLTTAGKVSIRHANGPTETTARNVEIDDLLISDGVASTIPTVPNTVGTGALLRTTAGGRKIYKYEIRPDPAITGSQGQAFLYVPEDKPVGSTAKLVLHAHGHSDPASTWLEIGSGGDSQSVMQPLTDQLADAGYIQIVPEQDATVGNSDAMARFTRARNYAYANWATTDTVMVGFSMGGGAAATVLHRRPFPVRGAYLVAPLLDYPTGNATIDAAYTTDVMADYEPMAQPGSDYLGVRVHVASSPGDLDVPRDTNAVPWLALIGPYAAEAVDVPKTGDHSAQTQWDPPAIVTFLDSAIDAPTQGSGTGTWTFTGSGAGKRVPKASGTGAFAFTGSGTGKRTPKASGTGAFAFAGSGAGTTTRRGSGTGSWTFTGSGSGTTARRGSGSGAWSFVGTGSGQTTKRGSGGGSWAFTGSGAGTTVRRAAGSGSWLFAGTGVGTTTRSGTGSGLVTWAGSGAGTAPTVGVSEGSGTGAWSFTGTGSGKRTPKGAGAGLLAWVGTGAGTAPDVGTSTGSGAGTWSWVGTGTGIAVRRGSGAGSWGYLGTGSGIAPTGIPLVTPPSRTFTILADGRTHQVAADRRATSIPSPGPRLHAVPADKRTTAVAAERRTLTPT